MVWRVTRVCGRKKLPSLTYKWFSSTTVVGSFVIVFCKSISVHRVYNFFLYTFSIFHFFFRSTFFLLLWNHSCTKLRPVENPNINAYWLLHSYNMDRRNGKYKGENGSKGKWKRPYILGLKDYCESCMIKSFGFTYSSTCKFASFLIPHLHFPIPFLTLSVSVPPSHTIFFFSLLCTGTFPEKEKANFCHVNIY